MTAPTDEFPKFPPHWQAPFRHAFAITKSDTANLTYITRAIWVGGTGNLVVDMEGGELNVAFNSVPAGTQLNIRAIKVKNSSTATVILGLY